MTVKHISLCINNIQYSFRTNPIISNFKTKKTKNHLTINAAHNYLNKILITFVLISVKKNYKKNWLKTNYENKRV